MNPSNEGANPVRLCSRRLIDCRPLFTGGASFGDGSIAASYCGDRPRESLPFVGKRCHLTARLRAVPVGEQKAPRDGRSLYERRVLSVRRRGRERALRALCVGHSFECDRSGESFFKRDSRPFVLTGAAG